MLYNKVRRFIQKAAIGLRPLRRIQVKVDACMDTAVAKVAVKSAVIAKAVVKIA